MQDLYKYFSRKEYLKDRDLEFHLTEQQEYNYTTLLLPRLNLLRLKYNKSMIISSGYRPEIYNKKAGGAGKSNHLLCLACDFVDSNGEIDIFCLKNLKFLEEIGLYLENPDYTEGWCHVQCVSPKSGARIFIP